MNGVTKQDLAEWRSSPVTRAWFAGIQAKIKLLEQAGGEGQFLSMSSPFETHANTARLVGRIEGLQDSLEIDENTVLGDDE